MKKESLICSGETYLIESLHHCWIRSIGLFLELFPEQTRSGRLGPLLPEQLKTLAAIL